VLNFKNEMKKITIALSLVCLFFALNTQAQHKNTSDKTSPDKLDKTNAPKRGTIKFDQELYHFGMLLAGEIGDYEIPFKNTGDAPVTIEYTRGSCACLGTRPSKEVLQPGEEAILWLYYDPGPNMGEEVRKIYIQTDAQKEPFIVQIVAKVVSEIPAIKK
jgi:hypothetical protein